MTNQLTLELIEVGANRLGPVPLERRPGATVSAGGGTPSSSRAASARARLQAPATPISTRAVASGHLRLDERTRAVGFRGIAQARRALAATGGSGTAA